MGTSPHRRKRNEISIALRIVALSAAGVLAVATAGCGASAPASPAEQLRAAISKAESAVESREISVLKELVAAQYADTRGQDRRAVITLVQGYLLRHRSIYLFTKVDSLEVPDPDRAYATLLVAMAGRRIESVEELWDVRADLLRLDLEWTHSGGKWAVVRADWRRALVEDFLPG